MMFRGGSQAPDTSPLLGFICLSHELLCTTDTVYIAGSNTTSHPQQFVFTNRAGSRSKLQQAVLLYANAF